MLLGALRSALSAKLRDGELKWSAGLTPAITRRSPGKRFEWPRRGGKGLLVDVLTVAQDGGVVGASRNITLASRNLQGVKLVPTRDVTVYDLLAHKQVLISEAAARKLSEALAV
jgi:large subunit ribosomal protein L4